MENLSPEEQLLRLIEGEDKSGAPASEPTIVEKPQPKEETSATSLLGRLGSLSSLFSIKTISLKSANRVLTLVSVLLALYLVWQISQAQADIANEHKELDSFEPPILPTIKLIEPKDILLFTKPLDRNIFERPEQPKIEIPAPPKDDIKPPPDDKPPAPPTQVELLIEQLKQTYKLVGIIKMDNENAVVTIEKGDESYVLTLSGKARITGIIGDFRYSFKIKEVMEDSVTLIEENSNKEMSLGFYK